MARKSPQAQQVTTGPGVLKRDLPRGVVLRMARRTFGWDFPFAVVIYSRRAAITPGTINGQYPTIDGESLKGLNGQVPMLDLKAFDGVDSWIAIEITRAKDPNTGNMTVTKMEVVHVQYLSDQPIFENYGGAFGFPNLPDGRTRFPLARIDQWVGGGVATQYTYHNQQYFPRDDGKTPRHYFVPA